jgi:Flp pilus assembly pilin Flp
MRRGAGTAGRVGDGASGQTIPEYALIFAALALVLAVSLLFLAGRIDGLFHRSTSDQPVFRPPTAACDPSYAGACIPPPPPDLDCSDLRAMGLGTVRVVGGDPHHLDPDGDAIACN